MARARVCGLLRLALLQEEQLLQDVIAALRCVSPHSPCDGKEGSYGALALGGRFATSARESHQQLERENDPRAKTK